MTDPIDISRMDPLDAALIHWISAQHNNLALYLEDHLPATGGVVTLTIEVKLAGEATPRGARVSIDMTPWTATMNPYTDLADRLRAWWDRGVMVQPVEPETGEEYVVLHETKGMAWFKVLRPSSFDGDFVYGTFNNGVDPAANVSLRRPRCRFYPIKVLNENQPASG
jgi:hypothetical protein